MATSKRAKKLAREKFERQQQRRADRRARRRRISLIVIAVILVVAIAVVAVWQLRRGSGEATTPPTSANSGTPARAFDPYPILGHMISPTTVSRSTHSGNS